MKVFAEAIVTNEFNQALFVLDAESQRWALPATAVEIGELPTEALVHTVEEETGLKILPVRLVALYYWPEEPAGRLLFSFRCLQRGGALPEIDEKPRAGFMDVVPPPTTLLDVHRHRLQQALGHYGGPPLWRVEREPGLLRAARVLSTGIRRTARALGAHLGTESPEWEVGGFVVLRNQEGAVLWVMRTDYDAWNLPGGGRKGLEAPWETAQREASEETGLNVALSDLTGVYIKPEDGAMIFTFTGEGAGGNLQRNDEAAAFAYYAVGAEPEAALSKQVERVADAVAPGEETVFRQQSGPSDLVSSGLQPSE